MNLTKRKWTITSIIVLIPIGFYTKFYAGPLSFWVNNSLGGIFYVIFWSLIVFLFIPRFSPWKISALVLLITCFLEILQLWHPDFLECIRSNFLGRSLLGTSFSWLDFLHYFFGSLGAFFLLVYLNKCEIVHK